MKKTKEICIWVSEDEKAQIQEKMNACHMTNMSAYILKMAIDGMIINLDIPELKEISSLLRYNGNNINQIAKHLNSELSAYAPDIADIKEKQARITEMVREIYLKLAKL